MNAGTKNPGHLIVLVGPSGVGKSTISRKLAEKMRLKYIVSATTRKKNVKDDLGKIYDYIDEKEFFRFEGWLRRYHKFAKRYPWYRLVEMWPRGLNSVQSFFAEYDAYLTDFGKKPRGLEDLFEVVTLQKGCTSIRRRRKLPKEVMRSTQPAVWWRSTANR